MGYSLWRGKREQRKQKKGRKEWEGRGKECRAKERIGGGRKEGGGGRKGRRGMNRKVQWEGQVGQLRGDRKVGTAGDRIEGKNKEKVIERCMGGRMRGGGRHPPWVEIGGEGEGRESKLCKEALRQ
jgi:hypothetical protein